MGVVGRPQDNDRDKQLGTSRWSGKRGTHGGAAKKKLVIAGVMKSVDNSGVVSSVCGTSSWEQEIRKSIENSGDGASKRGVLDTGARAVSFCSGMTGGERDVSAWARERTHKYVREARHLKRSDRRSIHSRIESMVVYPLATPLALADRADSFRDMLRSSEWGRQVEQVLLSYLSKSDRRKGAVGPDSRPIGLAGPVRAQMGQGRGREKSDRSSAPVGSCVPLKSGKLLPSGAATPGGCPPRAARKSICTFKAKLAK